MKGGTYAQAKAVGFNEKQAVFMANLGIDTKNEVWEEWENRRSNRLGKIFEQLTEVYPIFVVGFLIGVGITFAIMS